jgi:hypothetical protein
MSLVFEHSRSKGAARLVLLALADVAADDGEVTAYRRSYSVLARKANVSKEAVRKAIRELDKLGELKVLRQGDGRTRSDYQILVGPKPEGPPELDPESNGGPPQGATPLDSITTSLDVDVPSQVRDIRRLLEVSGNGSRTRGIPGFQHTGETEPRDQ